MRRSVSRWLAALSAIALGLPDPAAARPRYGGTLRIQVRESIAAIEPTVPGSLPSLVFERLVRLDARGRPEPALAVGWQHDPARNQWEFRLRPGVAFHDGSTLAPAMVVASLEPVLPEAAFSTTADSVVVRLDRPAPDLPARLARTGFIAAPAGGLLVGTGPFRLARLEPGRRASFAANENYWDGRPFLDAVEVEMGRPLRDQLIDLELNKADLVELAPGDARRAADRGRRLWTSAPIELLALGAEESVDPRLRQALAPAIDRAAMHSVLLQRQGEIAGGLLPQWLSGYAFLFPAAPDLARARALAAALPAAARSAPLVYDPGDPLARSIAERIAVNARDAGITLHPTARHAGPALRLVRLRIGAADPAAALAGLSGQTPPPADPQALYHAERALLESLRLIPLFHLPALYGAGAHLRTWTGPAVTRLGDWRLEDVWLAP
jgi:ABC-type transport system substrate-binding protein